MGIKNTDFKWDGKTRVSNDTYRKNFNKIFNIKEKDDQNDEREGSEGVRGERPTSDREQ
jgi:hypothetical protein|tara:strand:- start:636 stop:812 length:177 start_codon:yes stop_codon:yes gene_type:complete